LEKTNQLHRVGRESNEDIPGYTTTAQINGEKTCEIDIFVFWGNGKEYNNQIWKEKLRVKNSPTLAMSQKDGVCKAQQCSVWRTERAQTEVRKTEEQVD